MLDFRKLNIDSDDFSFVMELFVSAFPPEERRPECDQINMIKDEKLFGCETVLLDGKPIGFFSYWSFPDFVYIEHFAISDLCRNQGHGTEILKHMFLVFNLPIVLEIELPDNDIAKRRMDFYMRNGFEILSKSYIQPPYPSRKDSVPMYLMIKSDDMTISDEIVVDCLYSFVYQVNHQSQSRL